MSAEIVGGTKVFVLRGGAGLLIHDGNQWANISIPAFPDGCSAEYAAEYYRAIALNIEANAVRIRRSNINGAFIGETK